MIDPHEIWAAAQTPAYEPITNAVARIESLLSEERRDAARWRKFTAILQSSYNGEAFESDKLDVSCYMQNGWKNHRTVQAELRWDDKRDEPLDLGSAVDSA